MSCLANFLFLPELLWVMPAKPNSLTQFLRINSLLKAEHICTNLYSPACCNWVFIMEMHRDFSIGDVN